MADTISVIYFQIKLKEEELAQFLILRLYEKRDKSL